MASENHQGPAADGTVRGAEPAARPVADLVVAVAQFAPSADERANVESIVELTRAGVARGAGLVVFPEYASFFVDPVDSRFLDHAEPLRGPFTDALVRLAAETGATIVAGLAERTEAGDRFSNTVVAVGPDDGILAVYRKQHLYDAFGSRESDVVLAGDLRPPQLFVVHGLAVGLQTCYDLRFPEVTRSIVDAGADIVVVPSEWVHGPLKEHHWRTLVTARAIENTIFVAAADHVGPIGVGCSMIVDPMGVVLADAGECHGLAVAPIARERIDEVRELNPALRLRRYAVVPKA